MYLIFDAKLPSEVAAHYNVAGEVDRMMAKRDFWLTYGATAILLPALMTVLRRIDPRRSNYSRFQGYFSLIRWGLSLFIHVIFVLMIADQLGYSLPIPKLIIGAVGVLWMVLGNRMSQVKSNFFVGIRTPWALSDETNWNRTHRLAAKLWVVAGLLMFAAAWVVPNAWLAVVVLVAALGSALVPAAYSYVLYARGPRAN
ncbi:hypothetical protein E6C55_09665 [Cohnella fermenti]|uniref:DUF1648 domain-containing protein n=2 Tax=Cohnella fermenti TaxID=2565925 RepID=A0A4S4C1L5_9BACL|nr:hypothetical protein E6C55_09665 [Cohnella fermenti]